jgi:hypothetical protein
VCLHVAHRNWVQTRVGRIGRTSICCIPTTSWGTTVKWLITVAFQQYRSRKRNPSPSSQLLAWGGSIASPTSHRSTFLHTSTYLIREPVVLRQRAYLSLRLLASHKRAVAANWQRIHTPTLFPQMTGMPYATCVASYAAAFCIPVGFNNGEGFFRPVLSSH